MCPACIAAAAALALKTATAGGAAAYAAAKLHKRKKIQASKPIEIRKGDRA